MLKWIEGANRWIGLDDDCPCYFVTEDEDGWGWEDSWGFGEGGYDTADEAKEAAEEDCTSHTPYSQNGFTPEEIDEILGDILYEERRDNPEVFY